MRLLRDRELDGQMLTRLEGGQRAAVPGLEDEGDDVVALADLVPTSRSERTEPVDCVQRIGSAASSSTDFSSGSG